MVKIGSGTAEILMTLSFWWVVGGLKGFLCQTQLLSWVVVELGLWQLVVFVVDCFLVIISYLSGPTKQVNIDLAFQSLKLCWMGSIKCSFFWTTRFEKKWLVWKECTIMNSTLIGFWCNFYQYKIQRSMNKLLWVKPIVSFCLGFCNWSIWDNFS